MKKRLFAILLVIALVFSTFAVLAACQTTEYTVSFKRLGRTVFTLKTTNGKLTSAQVNEATQKNIQAIDNRAAEGYEFIGWFTDADTDENGKEVYSGEINYAKTYTEDFVYVAGYQFAPLAGEDNGYTILGVIGGEQDWGTDGNGIETPEEWKLEQDETEGWIYRIEGVELLPGDNFKVKTYGVVWDDGKVDLGIEGVNSVTLGEEVEVDLGSLELLGDIIGGSGNITVSQWVESATMTLVFNYRTTKISIVLTSLVLREELPDTEWILVGGFDEDEWASTTTSEALIFNDEGDGTYTITYSFKDSTKWRIKTNVTNWDECLGYTNIGVISKLESVEEDIPQDLFSAASDDNNIFVNYDCTLKLTINSATSTFDVEVQAITIPEPETVYWETAGYVIVGGFSDANWTKPVGSTSKYLFKQDETNKNIGTWTGDIAKDMSFKVATNISAWTGRINIGWGSSITSIVNGDGQTVTGLFAQEGSDNIYSNAKCNITITLDVASKTIAILVNSQDAVVTDEPNKDPWGIVGSAVGSWDNDVELELQTNGHHTITGQALAVGEFKIRKDKAWTTSVGSHTERIQIKSTKSGVTDAQAKAYFNFNQDNIKVVTACTVDIDFVYYSATNWTLIITVTA